MNKLQNQTILIASHNPKKKAEMVDLMSGLNVTIKNMTDFDLPEPEETGLTFAENAILKARNAWQEMQALGQSMICLADDSGLAVDALDGAPGIYSARWAGANKDFNLAMRRVVDELQEATGKTEADTSWTARFVSVFALVWENGESQVFEGDCKGHIIWPRRGEAGFGYDPIFQPVGFDKTFAEMSLADKQSLSHRGKAFAKMMRVIQT